MDPEQQLDEVSRRMHDTRAELRDFLGYTEDDEPEWLPSDLPRHLLRSLTGSRLGIGLLLIAVAVLALNPRLAGRILRSRTVRTVSVPLATRLLTQKR
jgi:hypothetical protein